MKKKSNNKGITLIALVITIIVLLIFAGITIGMLTGQNGILTQAQNSKQVTIQAKVEEMTNLAIGALRTENLNDTNKITPQALAEQINKDNNRTDVTASSTTFPCDMIYEEEGLQVAVDINLKIGEAENDTSNSVYSKDIDESQIAPKELFNFEPITGTSSNTKIASTGSLNDLPQKEARITGIKTEYCNLKGYDKNGQVIAEDTNYEIKYPGITDTLIIPYQVEIDGEMYKVTEVNLNFCWGKSYGENSYTNYPAIENIIYPNTVNKIIGDGIGGPNSSVQQNIILSDEITEIPRMFFQAAESLRSVKLPNKLTVINERAFSCCKNLESIKIPDNIKEIGNEAFRDCTNLSSVQYKGINYTSRTELETTLTNNNVKFYIWTFDDTGLSD